MPRLLLIDDDAILREVLAAALTRAGHTVIEAEDGRQGAISFHAEPVDLVITDLVMPDRDGLETIIALRRAKPDLPIIVMSGATRNSNLYLETALKLGARRMLAKPFTVAELLHLIDELLPPPFEPPPAALE